jgi:hypothetical protein
VRVRRRKEKEETEREREQGKIKGITERGEKVAKEQM